MEFDSLFHSRQTHPPHAAAGWRRRIVLPGLHLRTSERRLLLMVMDVIIANAALALALSLRTDIPTSPSALLALWRWFVTLAAVWLISGLFFDTYDLARSASTFNIVRSSSAASLAAVLSYTLIPFFTPPLQSRSLHFLFALLSVGGIVAWRVAYSLLLAQPYFTQRTLVVGAGRAGRVLVRELGAAFADANPYRGTGYQILGFIDDNPAYVGAVIQGVPVLGGRDNLVRLAAEMQIDEIVLAITHRHAIAPELFDALLRCHEMGLRLSSMPSLYERLLGRVPVDHLGRDLHMLAPMAESASERLGLAIKRGADLLIALFGMVALAVLAPIVALGNWVKSPGPLFYHQTRVGRSGRLFQMIKFRSMSPDAESDSGPVWAAADDPRVTAIGRLLRRTRLDELPQVVNILRGEMSLIGPRPERPEFVEQLAARIPFYRARHAVRPGITGWAQVRYRYGDSTEDARIKLEYDLYYVTHCSFWLDLNITLKTMGIMLSLRGR